MSKALKYQVFQIIRHQTKVYLKPFRSKFHIIIELNRLIFLVVLNKTNFL